MAEHFPDATGDDLRIVVLILSLEMGITTEEQLMRMLGETSYAMLDARLGRIRRTTRLYIEGEKRRLGVLQVDAHVRGVINSMASRRHISITHFPAGVGTDWPSWAISLDTNDALYTIGHDDAFNVRALASLTEAMGRLAEAGFDTVEVLWRGSSPWLCVHDATWDQVNHQRELRP